MLKKLVEKKVETFKQHFPEYQISKGGSVYYREGIKKVKKKFTLGGFSVTKGSIDKIGRTTEFETEISQNVFLITKTGKLMKRNNSNRFSNITLKELENNCYTANVKLKEIYLIGRKYEWMKNYPLLFMYKFFKSFSSLAEARKFLGFEFVSDVDFYSLFSQGCDSLTPMIKAKDKSNAVKLLKGIDNSTKTMLKDYIDLCMRIGVEVEIPAGKNKLKELHDNAVWEARKEDAENYSKKEIYEGINLNFEEKWKSMGLQFKRLMSPYEMFLTGALQKHCIGTNYYSNLNYYSFYSIFWGDLQYEIQIAQGGNINQFYGYDNSNPPKGLTDKVKSLKQEDYKHEIRKVENADMTNYPKDDTKKGVDDEHEDDLLW